MKMRVVMCVVMGGVCTGCFGYTPGVCRDACDRIYRESQCGIQRPGMTTQESVDYCEMKCAGAFSQSGSIGTYDPYEATSMSEMPVLENREQGAAWAECVENTSCEDLNRNTCAPIW